MEWENEWNCLCYSTLTSRKNTGQEKRFRLCMVLTPFPWCNPHPSLLLSLFLLHLNCSKVNDTHFLMKSNDVYLIHSSCSVCCLWHHCPTTLLIFLFLISDSTTWFYFPFYFFCPSSSLICWMQVIPLNLDIHQISACFICIFIIMWHNSVQKKLPEVKRFTGTKAQQTK